MRNLSTNSKIILASIIIGVLLVPIAIGITIWLIQDSDEVGGLPLQTGAIRPIATPTSIGQNPIVIDSHTDDIHNWFLIDVGTIQNAFVGNVVSQVHFNGQGSFTSSRTTINSSTITNSFQEVVSQTVSVSETLTFTGSVQVGPSALKISASESFSVTEGFSQTRSLSTNVSTAQTVANHETMSFTVSRGDAIGYYRIAMYATVDVFFEIKTLRATNALVSWEAVAAARNDFNTRFEFSPTPFDNTPTSNPIDFDDDFYQSLLPPNTIEFANISAGFEHSLAITACGQLWAWGINTYGRTGLGISTGNTLVPTRIGTATNWATIAAGSAHSLATTTCGQLWAWGDNGRGGATGIGVSFGNLLTPTRVGTATNWASVGAGVFYSLATTTCGQLWAWGRNGVTGLGVASGETIVPTRVGTATNWATIAAGQFHALATTTCGQLWSWGSNSNGRTGLGISNSGATLVPTRVGTATNWATVAAGRDHSLAITTSNQLWAWGSNALGMTGLGVSSGNTLIPTRVGTATNWATIAAGQFHALATTTCGQLWAWGLNTNGRTGLGINSGNTLVPTRVGTASNWAIISAGHQHSLGATTSGQLWAWGNNDNGRTGLGVSTGNILVPNHIRI